MITLSRPAAGGQAPGRPPPSRAALFRDTVRPWAIALPWGTALAAGLATLLAGTPVGVLVQGRDWPGHAAVAVLVVLLSGLLLDRWAAPLVAAGQGVALLVLLTARYTDDGVLGVLPGPRAVSRLGELINGAGRQINVGIAPVPATVEILVLVTAAFGLLAVAVHLAAVGADAPAAAGVPLLAAFAIPAALADRLLPAWTVVAAATGYGLLLIAAGSPTRSATRWARLRGLPAGGAMVAVAVALALGLGSAAGFLGTAGRFSGGIGGPGGATAIGLSPFTALRGQLSDAAPVELLRVRGLPRASYLRALTLNGYVSNAGWQASRPAPGMPLPGPVQLTPRTPGDLVELQIENVALYDYWLPLYGEPIAVEGLPAAQWAYDTRSGTGYAILPRQDDGWRERALLPRPTAAELRRVTDAAGSTPSAFTSRAGVDPRVIELARQLTAGRDNNFDRAMALQEHFTGPDSPFRYSLQTAPPAGDDALVEFLTVGRTGYCEQFASAMAVMLRAVGIPARVAVGFTGGTDLGEYRSIRTSDAHAWVEAYFPGTGWVMFDPTPLTDGRTIVPDYVLEARGELGPDGSDSAPTGPAEGRLEEDRPVPQPLPVEPPVPAAGSGPGDGGLGWPVGPLLAGVLVAAAVVTAPAVVRSRQRTRRLGAVAAGGPAAADAGWQELLAESADRGVVSPPSDTVRGTARRLVREHRLGQEAQRALRILVETIESSWYGDRHPGPAELTAPLRTVRAGITAGSPLTVRGRLLPRSVGIGWVNRRRAAAPADSTTAASGN